MSQKILLALGGATGSGKTALAVELAKQYPQLVILSADSRQVYKKLDIGTAKVGVSSLDFELTGHPEPVWRVDGVPQFLIDIIDPEITFTLADYQKSAYRLMHACWGKNKIPFLVGGTGLYLQAVIEGYALTGGGAGVTRSELESRALYELQAEIAQLQISLPATDLKNKRRLIRAIERAQNGNGESSNRNQPLAETVHTFVLTQPWEEQRALAPAMVDERLKLGLVDETKNLLASGINKSWLKSMGLSYRLVIQMLDGEFTEKELADRLVHEFRQLMRRQRTWFNRMPHAQKLSREEIQAAIVSLVP